MLQKDKIKHILVSCGLVISISIFKGVIIGLVATFLIGLLKEIVFDYFLKQGTYDKYDMYANIFGITCGLIILKISGVII